MATHFKAHTTQKVDTVLTTSTVYTDTNLQHVIDYIDELKVARAVSSIGPLKATGPDELRPIVLQMSSIAFIRYLTNIYKQVLTTGYTPTKWREMGVIFIPKVGKSDYGLAKSYRPITLSSFCLKTLERIIHGTY